MPFVVHSAVASAGVHRPGRSQQEAGRLPLDLAPRRQLRQLLREFRQNLPALRGQGQRVLRAVVWFRVRDAAAVAAALPTQQRAHAAAVAAAAVASALAAAILAAVAAVAAVIAVAAVAAAVAAAAALRTWQGARAATTLSAALPAPTPVGAAAAAVATTTAASTTTSNTAPDGAAAGRRAVHHAAAARQDHQDLRSARHANAQAGGRTRPRRLPRGVVECRASCQPLCMSLRKGA